MPLSLRLLGGLDVVRTGVVEPVRLDRPASLLVYLAVREDWASRSELAFLYRPDEPEERALSYVRKLVFRARRLPWSEGLEVSEAGLRWHVESDHRSFRRALASGDDAEAVALYRGPFLAGQALPSAAGFEAWREHRSEVVARAWRDAALRHAGATAREGRTEDASHLLERLLEADPLDEEALQARLRSLAAEGRHAEAVRVYETFRRTLEEETGLPPLETTRALVDAYRRETPRADLAAAPPRFRLPVPPTPFVGRAVELARLERILAEERPRLVTLVGLGGSGKTRLALEAVRRAVEARGAEAGYASFAGVPAAGVAAALVDALGVPWSDPDPEAALVAALDGREVLLVLDDVEQVPEAAHLLARWLARLPRTTVLAASRAALALRGEGLFDVSGLATPASATERAPDDYDAVRLFVACAVRVAPDFTPTRTGLEAIAEICRRVEGLPLAIELAASWIRTLSPERLLEALERNAALLTTALRDVPERHRSLWAVLDYTLERTPAPARAALARLPVFRGGFDLEAAERVAGLDLEGLLELMNRALVRRAGEGRYAMHALVRLHAARGGSLDEAEAEHARHFADLVSRLAPDLRGRDPLGALARMRADDANIERAWEHAVRTGDLARLDAMREGLDYAWYYRSRFATAARAFRAGLAAAEAGGDAPAALRLRARLLAHLAQYERALGDVAAARRRAHEAQDVAALTGDAEVRAHARLEAAACAAASDPHAAAEAYAIVLGEATALEDRYLEGAALNGLANALVAAEGDVDAAERLYRASLDAHEGIGNLEGVCGALINIGACRYDVGDMPEAERLWSEAAEITRRLGFVQREAVLHANLGTLAETRGDHEEARRRYERSLRLRREVGDGLGEAKVLHDQGRLAHARGRPIEARARLQEALAAYAGLGERAPAAPVHAELARVLIALGRAGEAERHVEASLDLAAEGGVRADLLVALLARAEHRAATDAPIEGLRLATYVEATSAEAEEALRTRAAALVEQLARSAPEAHPAEAFRMDGTPPPTPLEMVAAVRAERTSGGGSRPSSWNGGGTPRR